MSKQWGHGFHVGTEEGREIGERIGEATAKADLGMKALCLATAIRDAQKSGSVSQYVLCEVLIDILASECGGKLRQPGLSSEPSNACP
jgi:hypothetical protein